MRGGAWNSKGEGKEGQTKVEGPKSGEEKKGEGRLG